jgi:MFS family permease
LTRRGTAYGWYNLTIGIGALPASIIFGELWDRYGSPTAFHFGAALALLAALGMASIRVSVVRRGARDEAHGV